MMPAPELPLASEKPYVDSFELDPLYMRKCAGVLIMKTRKGLTGGRVGKDEDAKFDRMLAPPAGRRHKFHFLANRNKPHYPEGYGWLDLFLMGYWPPQINLPFIFPRIKLYLARMGRKRRNT